MEASIRHLLQPLLVSRLPVMIPFPPAMEEAGTVERSRQCQEQVVEGLAEILRGRNLMLLHDSILDRRSTLPRRERNPPHHERRRLHQLRIRRADLRLGLKESWLGSARKNRREPPDQDHRLRRQG